MFALVTVLDAGHPVGCVEYDGRLYPAARRRRAGRGRGAVRGLAALVGASGRREAGQRRRCRPVCRCWRRCSTRERSSAPGPTTTTIAPKWASATCARNRSGCSSSSSHRATPWLGPAATVRIPIATKAMDWEIELAAVIGTAAPATSRSQMRCRTSPPTRVAIDFSARDHNRAPDTFYKLDWVAGKAHDTCCPMGPRLVPASAIGDAMDLGVEAVGERRDQAGRPHLRHDLLHCRTDRHRRAS